jgi:metal-dependent amidase/aminoacylase/carboxypeptidase family protein
LMSLFGQLVATSELSPLFAEQALRRALKRAGVEADRMAPGDVLAAEQEIERTIRTFLPERAEEVMARVRRLAREASRF